jgi:hypothetical protein
MSSSPRRQGMVRMLLLSSLIAAVCLSCSDQTPTGSQALRAGADVIVGEYQCVVNVGQESIECSVPQGHFQRGSRFALYGTNQVKLTSSNVSYDSTAQIFSFDVNVKNLLSLTMGTTTGVDTVGLKAFYETGPSPTSYRAPGDTGTVSAHNADGYANFTGSHQAYYFYRQILAPSAVTPNHHWEIHCPPTVRTFSFVLRVFTRTSSNPGVTELVPTTFSISSDSLDALYAPGKLIYSHPRSSGPYPRGVLLLQFQLDATADEREAAINYVSGTSIGGDGIFYYILIADDGTGNPLWQAIDKLHALPQVRHAGPDLRLGIGVNFSRPYDGVGWRRTDWQLTPDSAAGENWGLEAIAAPYAWGCESGGTNAVGAVVDALAQHSRLVLSIIAAPGNDSAGTTGVVWHGTVNRSDASRDSTASGRVAGGNLMHDFASAILTAKVINISWGANYQDSITLHARLPNLPAVDLGADSLFAIAMASWVKAIIWGGEHAPGNTNLPLYVISAGNFQMDAFYSGVPQLKDDPDIGGRVIVVAASDSATVGHTRTIWKNSGISFAPGSDTGSLVEIAAPGSPIHMIDSKTGVAVDEQGTSLAAPYVAGVALLLKSFDPRLSSDSIKQLLIAGAQRGGWTSGGFPYLNAYQSLQLAASRTSAPLCGNRVAGQNGSIVVLRDSASQRADTIISGVGPVWEVNALHGGKHLIAAVGDNYDYKDVNWTQANGWAMGSTLADNLPPGSAGSAFSWFGLSHDYTTGGAASDTSVTMTNISATDSSSTYRIAFAAGATTYATKDFTVPRQFNTSSFQQYCQMQYDGATGVPANSAAQQAWQVVVQSFGANIDPCLVHAGYKPSWRLETADFAAYSPTGDSAYIVVNYEAGQENAPAFASCDRLYPLKWDNGSGGVDSADVTMNLTCGNGWGKTWTDGRLVYSVLIPRSGVVGALATRPLWNEQLANITYWAVGESGREWVADYTQDTTTYAYSGYGPVPTVDIYKHHSCTTRFQNLTSGQVVWSQAACSLWRRGFSSGISALRSASGGHLTVSGRALQFQSRSGGTTRILARPGTEIRSGSVVMWRSWSRADPAVLERVLRASKPLSVGSQRNRR